MKKLGVIVLVLLSLQIFAQDDSVKPQKLKKVKFEWGTVKLPANFVLMEDEAFFRNNASAVKPEVAYRDPSAQVNFVINNSVNRWGRNLVLLSQFQRSTILNMHKSVEFKKDEIIDVKKRKYLLMGFDSKIEDNDTPDGDKRVIKQFTYLLYTVKDGHLITTSIRLPNWMKEEGWELAAEEIIRSVRIK